MARRRARARKKYYLAGLLATSFMLGLLLGAVLISTWIGGPPALQLTEEENYIRSITIVGVEKGTGQGKLATLKVGLRTGGGRLLIDVPPYENEDTQKSFLDAMQAAERETGWSLEQVDIIVSIENLTDETTLAGPSASAAMAVALVATIRAKENAGANEVLQDAVVSASIDSTGRLKPVGEIGTKYEAVREAGGFSLFVVASNQSGHLPDYPGIHVEKVSTLGALVDLMLTGTGGTISSAYEVQPAVTVI